MYPEECGDCAFFKKCEETEEEFCTFEMCRSFPEEEREQVETTLVPEDVNQELAYYSSRIV